MTDSSIEAALDQWLGRKRRQVEPRFPPALETLYIAETAGTKITALKVATLIGIASAAIATPTLLRLLPDAQWAVLWVWCGMAIPVAAISCLAMWAKLSVRLQEFQAATCASLVALALSVVMISTAHSLPSVYLGGMSLLISVEVVAAGFRFRVAVVYSLALTIMFGVFTQLMPKTQGLFGFALLTQMGTFVALAVFGAWRVETGARHSYALMLREQLKQKALSRRNSELDELAVRDALTGLANRRAYASWTSTVWAAAKQSGLPVGLLVVDIDNFKLYNDEFGHAGGDACLRAVAACLGEHLRDTTDMVARTGGEEFVVVLPGAQLGAAGAAAERVRKAVEELSLPHASGAANAVVTVSCGAASLMPTQRNAPEDLFAAADQALYRAKKNGRNQVCLAASHLPPAHAAELDACCAVDQDAGLLNAATQRAS